MHEAKNSWNRKLTYLIRSKNNMYDILYNTKFAWVTYFSEVSVIYSFMVNCPLMIVTYILKFGYTKVCNNNFVMDFHITLYDAAGKWNKICVIACKLKQVHNKANCIIFMMVNLIGRLIQKRNNLFWITQQYYAFTILISYLSNSPRSHLPSSFFSTLRHAEK